MEELRETRMILKEAIEAYDVHTRGMQQLLLKSEERIDKTNDMVRQLVSVTSQLKETFEHHIDQAIKSRDHVMKQNTMLMQRLAEVEADLKEERRKHEDLMQQLVDCMMKAQHAGMSVNIKQ